MTNETELTEKVVNASDPLEELDLDLDFHNEPTPIAKPQAPKDQMEIIQTITRQNYGKILTSISDDFYQVVGDLQHKGVANENLVTNRLQRFVETRIERILHLSYGHKENISESLSIEEQDLLSKIQEAVSEFRNEINKKINSS